jgi:hypothetical protein
MITTVLTEQDLIKASQHKPLGLLTMDDLKSRAQIAVALADRVIIARHTETEMLLFKDVDGPYQMLFEPSTSEKKGQIRCQALGALVLLGQNKV